MHLSDCSSDLLQGSICIERLINIQINWICMHVVGTPGYLQVVAEGQHVQL